MLLSPQPNHIVRARRYGGVQAQQVDTDATVGRGVLRHGPVPSCRVRSKTQIVVVDAGFFSWRTGAAPVCL